MYLAVDIGGTKTLITTFTKAGKMGDSVRFKTPENYNEFLRSLKTAFNQLGAPETILGCVAAPGRIDIDRGIGIKFGNLPWENVHIARDVSKISGVPVLVENDARLAGLSEAKLIIDDFKRVLYITISTGIGYSLIIDGVIDHNISATGGNSIKLEHHGKIVGWETFASGKAITKRYGKQASEIDDPKIWKLLAHDFAVGIVDLIAMTEPEALVIGGGVGAHFDKFSNFLRAELKKYETPILPHPKVLQAKRPEDAVLYGCYELARSHDE